MIRAVDASDAEAIEAIASASRLGVDVAAELTRPQARMFVSVASDQRIVAFVLLWRLHDELEILDVATSPDSRRQGHGAELLRHVKDVARREGLRAIHLEARVGNEAARALYEAEGFVCVGERPRYYSDGETAVLYRYDA